MDSPPFPFFGIKFGPSLPPSQTPFWEQKFKFQILVFINERSWAWIQAGSVWCLTWTSLIQFGITFVRVWVYLTWIQCVVEKLLINSFSSTTFHFREWIFNSDNSCSLVVFYNFFDGLILVWVQFFRFESNSSQRLFKFSSI